VKESGKKGKSEESKEEKEQIKIFFLPRRSRKTLLEIGAKNNSNSAFTQLWSRTTWSIDLFTLPS
jgi:hypothetical protein